MPVGQTIRYAIIIVAVILGVVCIILRWKKKMVESTVSAIFSLLVFVIGILPNSGTETIVEPTKPQINTTSTSITGTAETGTEKTVIEEYADEIRSKIEKSYSGLHFEKGEIVTETRSYDTWTMSAEIDNFRLGNKAFLYQDFNGTYTTLFVPIHFTIHINQTLTYDKQTIDDLVGYARIYLHGIDRNGVLDYEFYSYFSSQYFASEELLYKHLCGNGSIVEEIPFE